MDVPSRYSPFIKRIGPEHGKNKVAHKFFAQIINENFLDAMGFGLFPGRFQFFTLT